MLPAGTLRVVAFIAGLIGLTMSWIGIWFSVLTSPINYCYHTAGSLACFHDLRTCEGEEKLAGAPITISCRWEDDPFGDAKLKAPR